MTEKQIEAYVARSENLVTGTWAEWKFLELVSRARTEHNSTGVWDQSWTKSNQSWLDEEARLSRIEDCV
jgi:hypothetical protein